MDRVDGAFERQDGNDGLGAVLAGDIEGVLQRTLQRLEGSDAGRIELMDIEVALQLSTDLLARRLDQLGPEVDDAWKGEMELLHGLRDRLQRVHRYRGLMPRDEIRVTLAEVACDAWFLALRLETWPALHSARLAV